MYPIKCKSAGWQVLKWILINYLFVSPTVAGCIVNTERRRKHIFIYIIYHCSLRISNSIDSDRLTQSTLYSMWELKTYLNQNRFSCMTPSKNCRYDTDEGHCAVGKCATGILKPPSLSNINCIRCVAISTDEFQHELLLTDIDSLHSTRNCKSS